MNGEIEQMSNIVISARKALYVNGEIEFAPSPFILEMKFIFAPKLFARKTLEVDSAQKWFDICKQRGLDDIKFIIPTASDRLLVGFSNTSQGSIVCFWKKGKVSCFSPWWKFDRKRNGWRVIYREQAGINLEKKKTTFINQTDQFKDVLSDIERFAKDIGFPYFADAFHSAHDALCDFSQIANHHVPAQVPDEFKGIYYAVETADVFGAMGSWTDSPPYYAHKMGLDKEYNELSDRLLKQLRYHLMYVVNECWRKNGLI